MHRARVMAGQHKQTAPLGRQDQELAGLRRSAQSPRFVDDLVCSRGRLGNHANRQT